MTNKITQKITSYRVKNSDAEQPQEQAIIEPSVMHEGIKRHDVLDGRTYKIKTPQSEHALYLTINDIYIDNVRHPYEIFINSKNMDYFQWVLSLTRTISAVFRKGGEIRFIANELQQVHDPIGGYWTKKGANGEKPRFMPSITAEIGYWLEKHFDYINCLNNGEKQPVLIETKEPTQEDSQQPEYPKNAEICPSCKRKSALRLDGCLTCVNGDCNYSKCG